MEIKDFQRDKRFSKYPHAVLVTGNVEMDAFNKQLLAKQQTGYWKIKKERLSEGDLIFLIMPNSGKRDGYPRNIYAGVISKIEEEENNRLLISVKKFHDVCTIESDIKKFLGGKTPPQGNTALEVWNSSTKIGAKNESVPSGKARRNGENDAYLPSAENYAITLTKNIAKSQMDSSNARQKRLAKAPKRPVKVIATTTIFLRNPDVIAEALFQANGKCQRCKAPAPFNRRGTKVPYLEVHHKKPLSKGGEDTIRNAIALCPNCHRKMHYG